MYKKIMIYCMVMILLITASCSKENPEPPVTQDTSDKITILDLERANQMSVLLDRYWTVRIEQTMGDTSSTDDYRLYNGIIANIYTSYYEGQKTSQSLNYDVFYVHPMEEKVYATVYVEHLLNLSDPVDHEHVLSQYFDNAEIEAQQNQGKTVKFQIIQFEDERIDVTVDAETLAVLKIEFPEDGRDDLICIYDEAIDGDELLNELDGSAKEVGITADFYQDRNAYRVEQTLIVPSSWELVPGCFDLYELYTDETCQSSFVYPGDGMDYEVYLSNARG